MSEADTELVKIRYMHPNRGTHAVYGVTYDPRTNTRTYYRTHKGGGTEVFYVRRADQEAQPDIFQIVEEPVVAESAKTEADVPDGYGDLPERLKDILNKSGYTPAEVAEMSVEELVKIKGIGHASAEKIVDHFNK